MNVACLKKQGETPSAKVIFCSMFGKIFEN